jgi:6-phosphogluconate dehydrogenase (decarboxylating)
MRPHAGIPRSVDDHRGRAVARRRETNMQIGLVGLGRMGANMSRRWLGAGHTIVGHARHSETVLDLVEPLPVLGDVVVDGGIAAIDVGAPAPVLTTALDERFMSRGEADFADRVLSAMRFGFGGHREGKG